MGNKTYGFMRTLLANQDYIKYPPSQRKIINYLKEKGKASIHTLSKMLSISLGGVFMS